MSSAAPFVVVGAQRSVLSGHMMRYALLIGLGVMEIGIALKEPLIFSATNLLNIVQQTSYLALEVTQNTLRRFGKRIIISGKSISIAATK